MAVRLPPLVDLKISSNFPTVLYRLLLSRSLNVQPSHEALLQSAPRIQQLPQQQSKHIFIQLLTNSFWIRNLKVSHYLHFFTVTWPSMLLQEEYSYVLLDAEYHKCNTQFLSSLTSQSSANDIFIDPIMKISMAGDNFSSSPGCQSANPSLIQS